jgi:carboxyl-terminal processing protease
MVAAGRNPVLVLPMKIASPFRRIPTLAACSGLVILSLSGCGTSDPIVPPAAGGPGDLALMQQVMGVVERKYVVPVPEDKLQTQALKGMLSGLDPHSDYLDEQEYQQMRSDLDGRFGGIGIEITLQNGMPSVISPIDGTPASDAGIQPGDLIVKIDGQPTNRVGLDEIVKHLRGTVGSAVKIEIARTNQKPLEVTLTRRVIVVQSVKSHLAAPGIGYVRITTFGESTATDFSTTLEALEKQSGGKLRGLVLDLRNNPGGLLDSAVNVAGVMLDGGVVVATHGRDRSEDQVYNAPRGASKISDTPIVVLIHAASASAAEIVAGALQDRQRATVMGTRSFGKGSVQSVLRVAGHGAVRLTTSRYYTPLGHSIQDRGIVPDIALTVPKDEQVANASLIVREEDLHGALENTGSLDTLRRPTPAPPTATPIVEPAPTNGDEAPINPALIGTAKDGQLAAAIKQLQSGAMRTTVQR